MAERNTDDIETRPLPVLPTKTERNCSLYENIYEEIDHLGAHDPSQPDGGFSSLSNETRLTASNRHRNGHDNVNTEIYDPIIFGSTLASRDLQQRNDYSDYYTSCTGLSPIDLMKKTNLFKRSPKEFLKAFESTHNQNRRDEEAFIIADCLKKTDHNVPILNGNLEQLALFACCSSPHVVKRALDALLNEIFLSISEFWRDRCRNILQAENIIRQSFYEFLKVEHLKAKRQRMTTYAWLITFVLLKCSKEECAKIVTEIKRFSDKTLKALLKENKEKNTFRYGVHLARESIKQIVLSSGKKASREPLQHNIKRCANFLRSELEKDEVRKLGKALTSKESWLHLHICLVLLQDLPKLEGDSKPITLIQMLIQEYRDRCSGKSPKNRSKISGHESWKFEILVYHVMLRLIRTSKNKAITTQVLIGGQGCENLFSQFNEDLKTTRDSAIAENHVKILKRTVFCAPVICLSPLIEHTCKGDRQDFIKDLSILHLRSTYKDKALEVPEISEVPTDNNRVHAYDVRWNGRKCLLKLHRHTEDDVLDQSEQKRVSLLNEIGIVKILNPLKERCPNIVRMLSSSTEVPIHMIIESESTGDLVTFLKNLMNSTEVQNLIHIAADICNAMIFLHEQKIIHRDLRAKNCLVFIVNGKPLAKLGDFHRAVMAHSRPRSPTLSGQISSSTVPKKTINEFSVPWMAVETLQFGEFSTASDVWSYGVLLFEIFTFGSQPYVNMPSGLSLNSDEDVREYVTKGGRLELHPSILESIQVLIKSTMVDADQRPTFPDIGDNLLGLKFKDDIYVESICFKMSHVYESASPDTISRPVNASAGGCTANGCFGECLNASDVAVPLNVNNFSQSHSIKEFIPASSRERLRLFKLECPSLAMITHQILHREKVELITEVGDLGNLKQFINAHGCSMENAIRYLSQIGKAVSFLHLRWLIHRNLRSNSVFVYSNGNAKLACFARVTKLEPKAEDPSSTIPIYLPMPDDSLRWSSPEVITDGEYSKASDMWAFGVMIWEMFSLIDKELDEISDEEITPYHQLTSKEQILSYLQRNRRLRKPNSCPDWLYEMMLWCWKHNTQDRAKAEDIDAAVKDHISEGDNPS